MDQARCRRRRLGTVSRPDLAKRSTTTTSTTCNQSIRRDVDDMNNSNNMGPDFQGVQSPMVLSKSREATGAGRTEADLATAMQHLSGTTTNQSTLRRTCDSSRTQPGLRRDGGMLYPGLHERVGACPIRSERRGTERNGAGVCRVEGRGGFFLGRRDGASRIHGPSGRARTRTRTRHSSHCNGIANAVGSRIKKQKYSLHHVQQRSTRQVPALPFWFEAIGVDSHRRSTRLDTARWARTQPT
jgi:hypothetical protein